MNKCRSFISRCRLLYYSDLGLFRIGFLILNIRKRKLKGHFWNFWFFVFFYRFFNFQLITLFYRWDLWVKRPWWYCRLLSILLAFIFLIYISFSLRFFICVFILLFTWFIILRQNFFCFIFFNRSFCNFLLLSLFNWFLRFLSWWSSTQCINANFRYILAVAFCIFFLFLNFGQGLFNLLS